VSRAPLVGLSTRRLGASGLGGLFPDAFADAEVDLGVGDYPDAVVAAGGLPVHLSVSAPAREIVEHLDALVLTGGDDVDSSSGPGGSAGRVTPAGSTATGDRSGGAEAAAGSDGSGQGPCPHRWPTDPRRDRWEIDLLRAALGRNIPVLAICRGAQLLNVALGGSLIPDLPAGRGERHPRLDEDRRRRVHEVTFAPGSLPASLYGARCVVNSLHHQAVDRPGEGLVVVGWAPDGTAEAVELPGRPVLAVQWHPESLAADPAFPWLVRTAMSGRGSARAVR